MSYLARLKQLDSKNNFTHTPETALPKLPKASSVSSGSFIPAHIEKNHAANDGEHFSLKPHLDDVAVLPITDMSGNSLASFYPDLPVHRSTPKHCPDCQYFARPGKSDGYCGGRDDLPPAYGVNHPLRKLPDDRGNSCDMFKHSNYQEYAQ
jgi:hypothetical protein